MITETWEPRRMTIEQLKVRFPNHKRLMREYRTEMKKCHRNGGIAFVMKLIDPKTFNMEFYVFDRYGNPLK